MLTSTISFYLFVVINFCFTLHVKIFFNDIWLSSTVVSYSTYLFLFFLSLPASSCKLSIIHFLSYFMMALWRRFIICCACNNKTREVYLLLTFTPSFLLPRNKLRFRLEISYNRWLIDSLLPFASLSSAIAIFLLF